jgi:hypothetical protein
MTRRDLAIDGDHDELCHGVVEKLPNLQGVHVGGVAAGMGKGAAAVAAKV